MKCQYCQEFDASYQCAKEVHGECSCPKCQGMCECKTMTNKTLLECMDWVLDHAYHFGAIPMEFEDGTERLWTYDEFMPFLEEKKYFMLSINHIIRIKEAEEADYGPSVPFGC